MHGSLPRKVVIRRQGRSSLRRARLVRISGIILVGPARATSTGRSVARPPWTLPRTGSSLAVTAATGLAFLLVGAALVAARRRATRTLA
jgi:LPXTG-motif cell wall-anchored protein